MLDTNIVSHFVRKQSEVDRRVVAVSMESLCISVITEGELLFGLARQPGNKTLAREVNEFLNRVDVLPWGRQVAADYARLRARAQGAGKNLASLDMLIAAHAFTVGATLVTNDAVFSMIAGLAIEDWTRPLAT
jgi:tRNA(fMet)-specific endonuclease VapC